MAKLTLHIEEDYDFILLGISCHVKDYRLSWEINHHIGLRLSKEDNLAFKIKAQEVSFSLYAYYDEDNLTDYFLISNRSQGGLLIPEQKNVDYFLQIKGPMRADQRDRLLHDLNQLSVVLTVYEVEVEQLKSKENLIF